MKSIELLTVGVVEGDVIRFLEDAIHRSLGLETRRVEPLPNADFAYDEGRSQYHSARILCKALEVASDDAIRLLAVTEVDLYLPMLTFVFGQAQLGGRVAAISLARLRQEFYGLPADEALLLSRVAKEALHELGHSFGLVHCPSSSCAMSLSFNILQVDAKGFEYCSSCHAILGENLASIRDRAPLAAVEEGQP